MSFRQRLLLVMAGVLGWLAVGERNRAEQNLFIANQVVDQLLLAAGGDSERDTAEIPEMEAFRKKLLTSSREHFKSSPRWMARGNGTTRAARASRRPSRLLQVSRKPRPIKRLRRPCTTLVWHISGAAWTRKRAAHLSRRYQQTASFTVLACS